MPSVVKHKTTFIYNPLYLSQNQTFSLSETVAVISHVLPFEACLFGIHPIRRGVFKLSVRYKERSGGKDDFRQQ
jgi:hypothetical protein